MQIHQIQCGPLQANCYLIEESGAAVLIDCGGDGTEILAFAAEKGLKIKAVLLTHGHIDHIEGADRVVEQHQCPLYIHEKDAEFPYKASLNLSSQIYRMPIVLKTAAIPFKDGERLNIDSLEFDVIHTPGHTPGSVCFRFREYLFTGDTLFYRSVGNEFPPYGNFALEIESICHRLFTLESDFRCYPGHGEATSLSYEKINNPYCRV
ncbi:MAG: MBL fold metallo-hydrolase [Clostridia bacterium]|nr:MBL fold metallo-hydrolase [Clostridia bacterium]